ncbi:Crp/Fnr family transcriptional regulator [Cumulibacter manganitolerans]|uniref:Crp/Fnr family transcriptional regulator n=1 Tax=Cumulibacter manganitolerans TaxID=1884992 RepID=UPI00129609B0|nr:Crp/Fnr family transcriptional regulator [Cumulibacter manganitolerans]
MSKQPSAPSGAAAAHDHRFHCVSLVPIFATLSEDDRHRVAAVARTRYYDRQQRIFAPGDHPGLHIVHRGQVKLYRLTDSGAEQLVRIVGPGDFLGETALLTTVEADDFAEAVQPSEVCSISRDDITALLERSPDVALDLLKAVAGRLHVAESQLSALSGLSVGERLARHLLEQSVAAGGGRFRLATTKKDLASYLGTTPETISRRLAAMRERGLIRLGPGRLVEILDAEGLRGFQP